MTGPSTFNNLLHLFSQFLMDGHHYIDAVGCIRSCRPPTYTAAALHYRSDVFGSSRSHGQACYKLLLEGDAKY